MFSKFCGLDFETNQYVLPPYAATEKIVAKAIELLPENGSFCDFGTGSGNIAISILHARPDVTGVGIDISDEALEMAAINANTHGVRLELDKKMEGRFDLIISNGPYLTADEARQANVASYPPSTCTDGKDGLTVIRYLAKTFRKHTDTLLLEYEKPDKSPVTALFTKFEVFDVGVLVFA